MRGWQRLLLSSAALLVGVMILLVSLFSATQVSSNNGTTASGSKLYFASEILPDHILYKGLMAIDRVQLETADHQQRIFMEIEYAHRRLGYAWEMLDRDKPDYALTTLTKAEKYLFSAAAQIRAGDYSDSVKLRLKKAFEYHQKQLQEIKSEFSPQYHGVIEQLIVENAAMLDSI